jgi:hypothetical protein
MADPKPLDKNSFYPFTRVTFVDMSNPDNMHIAMFNPQTLQLSTKARVGRLNPIGYSQSVKQYGGTDDSTFPMELVYSKVAFDTEPQRVSMSSDFQQPLRYFQSFLYSPKLGLAPSWLLVDWLHTLSMTVVVEGVDVIFRQWDTGLNLRAFAIQLQLAKVSEDFVSSGQIMQNGFMSADSRSPQARGQAGSSSTGKPMKIKGRVGNG